MNIGDSLYGSNLSVGIGANGALAYGCVNISNGGNVNVHGQGANQTTAAFGTAAVGPEGMIHFGPNGGSLTCATFSAASQMTGTGNIYTDGGAWDANITFDAAHPQSQPVVFPLYNSTGTVSVNLTGASPAAPSPWATSPTVT